MPEGLLGAVVQVAIALIASGILVKLLTLRQDRRKIAGEASSSEASAASQLSGAALQMVESAQKSASEASAREQTAQGALVDARVECTRLWQQLNSARWEAHWQQTRGDTYEATLRLAGVTVPVIPKQPDHFPTDFPPPIPPASTPGQIGTAHPPGDVGP